MQTTETSTADSGSTLDTVEPGQTVCVTQLRRNNPALFRKLHAMGLVAGSVITVLRRAPFGDPISVTTLGYTLSLWLA
ncbi:MAG: ferrous iron transport protein A, partial [Bdellovibrionales bacterium]|nr:ferrous iron transport protein A [Bdellovibrionales bacterium]